MFSIGMEPSASCVEPFCLYLEELAVFTNFWLFVIDIESASCVEPLCLYLEGLAVVASHAVFSWYSSFQLVVLSPFCLFLRTSLFLTWLRRAVAHVFGNQVLCSVFDRVLLLDELLLRFLAWLCRTVAHVFGDQASLISIYASSAFYLAFGHLE